MTNNPMLGHGCLAELEFAEFSKGNLKNLSATVVVDTDQMSGDVVELNDDMLAGLEIEAGLKQ